MKAEQIIETYKIFIEMCAGRDITDVSDVHFLFKLYIEQIKKDNAENTKSKLNSQENKK